MLELDIPEADLDANVWFNAVNKGDIETLQQFVNNKFDVDTKDEDGWTALILACYSDKRSCPGNYGIVKFLLDNGANKYNWVEMETLYPIDTHNIDFMNSLKEQGAVKADNNTMAIVYSYNAGEIAFRAGNTEIVKLILDHRPGR